MQKKCKWKKAKKSENKNKLLSTYRYGMSHQFTASQNFPYNLHIKYISLKVFGRFFAYTCSPPDSFGWAIHFERIYLPFFSTFTFNKCSPNKKRERASIEYDEEKGKFIASKLFHSKCWTIFCERRQLLILTFSPSQNHFQLHANSPRNEWKLDYVQWNLWYFNVSII